jgi:hypothetical protein
MLFVDTSSLFKFYYPEPQSDAVEARLLAAERVAIAEITRVEMASVAARKVRMGEITRREYDRVVSAFEEDLLSRAYAVVTSTHEVIDEARLLVERIGLDKPLRTLDSLQLASALRSGADEFLSHDQQLTEAAGHLGLNVARI